MLSTYLLFASLVLCYGQISEVEEILELTQSNFELAKGRHENLFVEFYAPWCGHCKSIAPEYEKAAKMMKEEGFSVQFAKINGDEEVALRTQYNITGYPTFKFFLTSRQRIIDYKVGRHAGDFVTFVKKKVASSAHIVNNVEDAVSIVEHNKLIYFGFFKDAASEAAQVFKDFAFDNDKTLFIFSSEPAVAGHFQLQADAVVAFKHYDEGKAIMATDITYANLKKFHSDHQLPLVSLFLEENAEEIFSTGVKNYLVLFVSGKSEAFGHVYENLRKVAQSFIGKVVFLYVDIDEEENEKVLEFFGLPAVKCPAIRFINLTLDDPIKYNPSSPDLDVATMQAFVSDVLQGTVKPFFKSDDVPSNWDQTIKVLVGSTFEHFINNAPTNVIVNFYVPWCGHCKKLASIWQALGEALKDSDKVIVAKVDSSTNELSTLKVDQFPTIKLFIKGTKEVVEFTGERSLEALVAFVESNGKIIKVPESTIPEAPHKDEL